MDELIALPYSPWSEKARWALDWHGLPYRERRYSPLFGEPGLRRRSGRWRGKITVPAWHDEAGWLFDSFAIARRADARGSAEPLIPAEQAELVTQWNDRGETAMAAGRALLIDRVARTPAAQDAYLPRGMPRWLRRWFGGPLARFGLRYFRKKYRLDAATLTEHQHTLEAEITRLATALPDGRVTLLDRFSFADIAMAQALQFVAPVADQYIRLSSASRGCWGDAELAARYPQLIAWRDRLYQTYRSKP